LLVSENGTAGSFTIVLNSQPKADVRVNVSSSDISEGMVSMPSSGYLDFTNENWNVPQSITVQGVDDSELDGNQVFEIQLTVSTRDNDYTILDPINVEYINNDDEKINNVIPDPLLSERLIDWSDSGVPGGIAQYHDGGVNARTLGANVVNHGADPTGVSDSTTAFTNALAATSAGQYVYVPNGTYRVTSYMTAKSNVTWRGQNASETIIKLYGNTTFLTMSGDWPYVQPTLTVTAGAVKGSNVLTVNDTSAITVGKHVLLSQLTPPYCHANAAAGWNAGEWVGHGADRLMTIMFLVTAKNDTTRTVTLNHTLPIDMTASPMLTVFKTTPRINMGIENMTFDAADSSSDRVLFYTQTYGCWLYKVYFKSPKSRSAWIQESTNFTVENCYFKDGRNKGMNSEGLDFYSNACWNIVINNIFISCGYPMVMYGDWQGGCVGNVTAYNYQYGQNQMADPDGYGPVGMCDGHGPVVMFNLWEGNYMEIISSDGYWGSSCFGTVFRNRISGVTLESPLYHDQCAIVLNHWSDYYSIIGNVLGTSGNSVIYQASGGSAQSPHIYRLGYPWMGNRTYTGTGSNPSDSRYFDTFVEESIIRHGNFDFVNKRIKISRIRRI
jgi:hypothetical protein